MIARRHSDAAAIADAAFSRYAARASIPLIYI